MICWHCRNAADYPWLSTFGHEACKGCACQHRQTPGRGPGTCDVEFNTGAVFLRPCPIFEPHLRHWWYDRDLTQRACPGVINTGAGSQRV